jgi:integrase
VASGSLILYHGKRGDVWRMKYADASGKQVMETIGPAKCDKRHGLTRKEAKTELTNRLSDVDRKNYRKPKPLTFDTYSQTWLDDGQARRKWAPGTPRIYRASLARLREHFGPMKLAEIRPRHVADFVTVYVKTMAASTVNRDLSILHDILNCARRAELIETNPAERAERPKVRQKKWRILKPVEVGEVLRAFDALADQRPPLCWPNERRIERGWIVQARVAFQTLVQTGVRRHELQGLRWRDVDLVENVLRIVASKSEDGVRSIAIPPMLAEALWQHKRRSVFQGDDDRVFPHIERGTVYRPEKFEPIFRAALRKAGITEYVRPFHDLRHTAITNDAASGASPIAVMTKAGHSNMATTKRYLHLAGVVFHDEAAALERRLLGGVSSTDSSTDLTAPERISGNGNARSDAVSHAAG